MKPLEQRKVRRPRQSISQVEEIPLPEKFLNRGSNHFTTTLILTITSCITGMPWHYTTTMMHGSVGCSCPL